MKSLKCVLIGDSGVGKTSLVVTYGTNKFPSPTDFVPCVSEPYHRDITVYSGETVNIGIFDIGGKVATCQMAKFDPLLSLDCTRVEGGGAIQGKEGIKFCSVV